MRQALADLGIAVGSVQAEAFGDTRQVQACTDARLKGADLRECLLPNRRVDVIVEAVEPPR